MSTLTTEDSSPVKVAQVFADFRHGMPDSGTVYVGVERHRVRVYRTAGGLLGECACPGGCGERSGRPGRQGQCERDAPRGSAQDRVHGALPSESRHPRWAAGAADKPVSPLTPRAV